MTESMSLNELAVYMRGVAYSKGHARQIHHHNGERLHLELICDDTHDTLVIRNKRKMVSDTAAKQIKAAFALPDLRQTDDFWIATGPKGRFPRREAKSET